MPNYYIKGHTVNTDLKYYRIVRSSTFEVSDRQGILTIGLPSIVSECEPARKIKEVYFNYNGAKYRRKSLEDIKIRIYFIKELEELYRLEEDTVLILLVPGDYSLDKLTNDLVGNLLELVEGKITKRKDVNILLDKNLCIEGESKVTSYRKTVERYCSDMTSILDSFLGFFENYANKQGLTFYNELVATDYTTKELLLFKYNEYLINFTKFMPVVHNEFTEYKLHARFTIRTASISKFERLLAEINSLKYLTNIVRVKCIDKTGVEWNIPIYWDPQVTTNTPDDVKSDNDVSFEIVLTCTITLYTIREAVYHPIIQIINELGDVKLKIESNYQV